MTEIERRHTTGLWKDNTSKYIISERYLFALHALSEGNNNLTCGKRESVS